LLQGSILNLFVVPAEILKLNKVLRTV